MSRGSKLAMGSSISSPPSPPSPSSPSSPPGSASGGGSGGGPLRTIRVVAAVLERDGRYLITQRRATAVLPLMWEFPGGRVEAGETDVHALKREVMHRLGADIECGKLISFVSHPYEHYVVDLFLYECRLLAERLENRAVSGFKWVASADFDQYPFTPADEASMNTLLGV